ncbi:helicase POLQ-like isoform X18 [Mustela erminea]|uniref:helicase POLQ-like isoform X18 n=1 Tax=Mustela erminea TaxID=36723 RepID=UPI001386DC02|nr:helicase POLQ-like isoform X18 [Mustela erminea]
MDEGGSRLRRRVSVRKRARPSPGEPRQERAEEPGAGSRRRRTAEAQPLQSNDSDEDMFGDYDSFAENSFLAHVDDAGRQCMQDCERGKHAAGLGTEGLRGEGGATAAGGFAEWETDEPVRSRSRREDASAQRGTLEDVPSSQALYFGNVENSPAGVGNQRPEERGWEASSLDTPNEEFPRNSVEQHQQPDDASSEVRRGSEENRRKSLKEHLKSAMTGNARAQTPVFSRTKQLKETLLSEEISVAKKTMESSSDDLGPFYSLPSKVRDLYVQFKGIEKLYGCLCRRGKEAYMISLQNKRGKPKISHRSSYCPLALLMSQIMSQATVGILDLSVHLANRWLSDPLLELDSNWLCPRCTGDAYT